MKSFLRYCPIFLFFVFLFGCIESAPANIESTTIVTGQPRPEIDDPDQPVERGTELAPYPRPKLTKVWPTSASGYPSPEKMTATPPLLTQQPTGQVAEVTASPTTIHQYLPAISNSIVTPVVALDIPTETPPPTRTPTATPTPIVTLDFAAVRAEMSGRGVEMGTGKIGFHVGPGGNRNGLGEYMRRLDEAGVPFFLKSVSDAGALLEAQQLRQQSGVPHVLVYRYAATGYDVPDYSLPPADAARKHWDLHMEKWPTELDPSVVWLETINEVDKGRSEWLAEFSLETAAIAEANGFKWAAFGWSSGEPEVEHWQGEKMQAFLRLAASKPDQLAIALHEYSYRRNSIEADAPYLVGRFQSLYQVTDGMGINRPTVLITEWGWTYEDVPDVDTALKHIDWANRLYAPYPQVKGAAIWSLGPGYGDIANQTQRLIMPMMGYDLTHAFER